MNLFCGGEWVGGRGGSDGLFLEPGFVLQSLRFEGYDHA